MELKVWVEGVVKVVCGLSLDTSCQDVVVSLAQAIGQTGRYLLILKLRGTERSLGADDSPLQHVAKLGQLATEVQFILKRTGPSPSAGPEKPTRERRFNQSTPSEPETLKPREPNKALSFNQGPSTFPRRTKPKRDRTPSPRGSPEPRASPVFILDSQHPVKSVSSSPSKEEIFKQVLLQQRRRHDLKTRLQALEMELWEQEKMSDEDPSLTVAPAGELEELEELEERLRQNQAELMLGEHWEEQLQAEVDTEQDLHRRRQQIHSTLNDHSLHITELQARSTHLEQDLQLRAHKQNPLSETLQANEVLRQELRLRLQQGEELDSTLSQEDMELQAAEERLQGRWEEMEELDQELRESKHQRFPHRQSGDPSLDQNNDYLNNTSILEV